MILFIDSTNFNAVTYALVGQRTIKRRFKVDPHRSHLVLEKLQAFLKSAKVTSADIKKIMVNKGPGSFTGTRVGIAHALALGLAWEVPVKALEKKKFSTQLYQTKKHRR